MTDDPIIAKLRQSAEFIKSGRGEQRKVPHYYRHILGGVMTEGLWLDFCIGKTSATTQHILRNSPPNIIMYGFDWFRGLPEDWVVSKSEIHQKGTFSISSNEKRISDFVSQLEKANPKLRVVVGLIQDTLPKFLEEHDGPCAFIHFDCDLYSSTESALRLLRDRLVPGTVIAFDEIWNFDNYRECEYAAFLEHIHGNFNYEFIAHVSNKRQAAIRILD